MKRQNISATADDQGDCEYALSVSVTYDLCTDPANARVIPYNRVFVKIVKDPVKFFGITVPPTSKDECSYWSGQVQGEDTPTGQDLGRYNLGDTYQGVRYQGPLVYPDDGRPAIELRRKNISLHDTMVYDTFTEGSQDDAIVDLKGKLVPNKTYYIEVTLRKSDTSGNPWQRTGRFRTTISIPCSPSPSPSPSQSYAPSPSPSYKPSATPSYPPSYPPSRPPPPPGVSPSPSPTGRPSSSPSGSASSSPSTSPSASASASASVHVSGSPSGSPSSNPSQMASGSPSGNPSGNPSVVPTWTALPSGTPTPTLSFTCTPQPASMLAPNSVTTIDSEQFGQLSGLQGLGPVAEVSGTAGALGAKGVRAQLTVAICQSALVFNYTNTGGLPGLGGNQQMIRLPPLPEGFVNPVVYRQRGYRDWVRVPDQQLVSGSISIANPAPGYYRVFVQVVNQSLSFGEVYVYPNPIRAGMAPKLHVGVGRSATVSVRIYDVSGDLVFQGRIDTPLTIVNGKPCYEYALDSHAYKPGVYIAVVTATDAKTGETARGRCRFSVLQ